MMIDNNFLLNTDSGSPSLLSPKPQPLSPTQPINPEQPIPSVNFSQPGSNPVSPQYQSPNQHPILNSPPTLQVAMPPLPATPQPQPIAESSTPTFNQTVLDSTQPHLQGSLINSTPTSQIIQMQPTSSNSPSKGDEFFKEFNNPKLTAIGGMILAALSIFMMPFQLYSISMLMGIYGIYHSAKQKKWILLGANITVCVVAVVIKMVFHKK